MNQIIKTSEHVAKSDNILREANFRTEHAKLFEGLDEISAGYARLSARVNETTQTAAEDEWNRIAAEYSKNPSDEQWATVSTADGKRALKDRYRGLNDLAIETLKTYCAEKVAPFVLPLLEAARAVVDSHVAALGEVEQAAAEHVGVPYNASYESYTILCLRTRLRTLDAVISAVKHQPHSQGSPEQLLAEVLGFSK